MLADPATKYTPPARNDVRTYKGIGVSPGIAVGRAVIIERREASVFRVPIRDEEVAGEVNRFLESLKKTKAELHDLAQKVRRSMGEEYASIFDAHAMMLSDPSFADKVVQKIESEQVNAEWAVAEVAEELQARFQSFDDDYLRERVADVKDVADRMQKNLQGVSHHDLSEITHDVIILADDLTPSDTIHFNRRPIVGFATEAGGRTSHTSIIAKSLFMPAVIGVARLTKIIDNDEMIIVDGYEGTLIVNPTQAMIADYQSRVLRHEEAERKLLENRAQPAVTKDNHKITLQANIELVEELKDAVRFGAEGIGLYRSEFLYISKSPELPTEEEHLQLYRALADHRQFDVLAPVGTSSLHAGLIHKEWPETLPGRDADRRGLFDLPVLAPSQLAQASIDQFRQGRIHAPIVVEVGLDYGRAHLEQELEKLRNSEAPYAYVVHFSRLPAGGKVEDLLTAAYPNIRTANAHVPPTGGRAVKHLTDTDIIRPR